MAKRLELQLQGSTNFAFDVEGSFLPTIRPIYAENGAPPEVAELRTVWIFSGCRMVSSDGTQETLWTEWNALLARLEDRTNFPTYARLVRDPSGDNAEVWKLDGSTYEQFRVDLLQVEQTEPPEAHFNTAVAVTLELSAVKKRPHAVTGIVGWQQSVRESYRSGLRTLEWVTRITTADGTSAKTKAQTYAAIDITSLDATYTYETGNATGGYGVDVDEIDADERAGRVATVAVATSRVRQWGVPIGASGPGAAPDEVDVRVRTTVTADETVVTTTAFARGPNAEQFVIAQKPGGTLSEDDTEVVSSGNEASGRWVRRTSRNSSNPQASRSIDVVVSGGRRAVRPRSIAGGHPALIQRGGLLVLRCEVKITVRRQGGTGLSPDMPLPKLLGEPWVLDPAASSEGLPMIEGEPAADWSQNKWVRQAVLVYYSSSKPNVSPLATLQDSGNTEASYHLS